MFEDIEKLQTPAIIEMVTQMRKARYDELQKLPRWTDDEAEEIIVCASTWMPQRKIWSPSSDLILLLCFDARMPTKQSEGLQRLINGWAFIGKPEDSSIDKYR